MWLPTPVYERVPLFWLLLGLLFIACGLYLGIGYRLFDVYIGVGSVCVVWSLVTLILRVRNRNKAAAIAMQPEEVDDPDSA